MKKRLLAILMAICMVATMLPVVSAAGVFTDVDPNDWYGDEVAYVYEKGLMNGTGDGTTFSPAGSTSRAMIWTILARMSGVDTTGAVWYQKGMEWAMAAGVSDGTDPTGDISREMFATMLYRYAGQPQVSESELAALGQFGDYTAVSTWAEKAMAWAVSTGVITGMSGKLEPQAGAQRCMAAVMLYRFCETVLTEQTKEYTVTLTYNYAGMGTYQTIKVKEGTLLGSILAPSRPGYTFIGWYTADGKQVTATTPITSDLVLLAGWVVATPGYVHYHTYAADWSSDETGHWHADTCGCNVKSDEAAHSYGNDFNCVETDTCDICHYAKAAGEHSYVRTLSGDETVGTFTCSGCGASYTENYVAKIGTAEYTYYTTLTAAAAAATSADTLTLLKDNYTLTVEELRAAVSSAAAVVDFNGATTTETIYDAYVAVGTIKNLNSIDMKNWYIRSENVTFENCTFKEGSQYAFHVDSIDTNITGLTSATITFTDCEFSGIIALGSAITSVTFDSCAFKTGGTGHDYINSRQDMTFTECTFVDSFGIDDESNAEQTWTFTNCTGVEKVSLNGDGKYQTVNIVWDGSSVSVGELRSLVSSCAAVVDFKGATTEVTIYDAYVAAGTIKNLNTIDMKNWYIRSENVTFENCTFKEGSQYAFHVDSIDTSVSGLTTATITFTDCEFSGIIALGSAITSVTFDSCAFKTGGTGHDYINSRQDMTFTECTFVDSFGIDDESNAQQTLTFTNCTNLNNVTIGGSKSTVTVNGLTTG